MKRLAQWLLVAAAAFFASAAMAQVPVRAGAAFSQPELDQMLAPIALYPDSLLSQILMAATYPQDVAEAASWSRAQGGLRGEQAVRAVEDREWDPSVVSLAAFPEVLAMMDERREWTARLGDAFLGQPDQVMDTVQDLRARADEAGNLRSSPEMVVQRQGEDYLIDSPTPDYVYVPYYDPRVVYGDWWWPAYQPIWWSAWPGYSYVGYGFRWGPRVRLGGGFFFGSFDWRNRYLRYANHRPWYYHGRDFHGGVRWSPGDHRRDDRNARRDTRGDRGQVQRAPRTPDYRASAPSRAAQPQQASAQQGFFTPRPEGTRMERARSPQVDAQRLESQRIAGQRFESQRIESQRAHAQVPAQPQYQPGVRSVAPRYGVEGRGQVHREQAPQYQAPAQGMVERPMTRREPVAQQAQQVQRNEPRAVPQQAAPAERGGPARGAVERGGERGRER